MKRKRPSNTFFVLVVIIVFVLFLILWFFKDLETYNSSVANNPASEGSGVYTSQYTPSPTTIPKVATYKNNKYNFQFDYINEVIYSETHYQYKIEEKDNVIKEIAVSLDRFGNINSETTGHEYIMYDVNESDGQDLKKWWSENIKTEIYNKKVPGDYQVETTAVDELCAVNPYLKEKPKAISVYYPKELGVTTSSTYYYFNFGKPFILHFSESSSGGCSITGPYLHFSIRPQ